MNLNGYYYGTIEMNYADLVNKTMEDQKVFKGKDGKEYILDEFDPFKPPFKPITQSQQTEKWVAKWFEHDPELHSETIGNNEVPLGITRATKVRIRTRDDVDRGYTREEYGAAVNYLWGKAYPPYRISLFSFIDQRDEEAYEAMTHVHKQEQKVEEKESLIEYLKNGGEIQIEFGNGQKRNAQFLSSSASGDHPIVVEIMEGTHAGSITRLKDIFGSTSIEISGDAYSVEVIKKPKQSKRWIFISNDKYNGSTRVHDFDNLNDAENQRATFISGWGKDYTLSEIQEVTFTF